MLPARVEEVAVPGDFLCPLDLGQVEIDTLPAARLRPSRVEERQGGAEDGRRHGPPVHAQLVLVQVETPLAVHEEGQLTGRDAVLSAARSVRIGELAVDRGQTVLRRPHGVYQ